MNNDASKRRDTFEGFYYLHVTLGGKFAEIILFLSRSVLRRLLIPRRFERVDAKFDLIRGEIPSRQHHATTNARRTCESWYSKGGESDQAGEGYATFQISFRQAFLQEALCKT